MHYVCEDIHVIACVCSLRLCVQTDCAEAAAWDWSCVCSINSINSKGQNKHSARYTYKYTVCHLSALWTFINEYHPNSCKLCLTCITCKCDIQTPAAGAHMMIMACMNIMLHGSHYLPVYQTCRISFSYSICDSITGAYRWIDGSHSVQWERPQN